MSIIAKFRPLFVHPKIKHTGSLIFLHGSGDTGQGVKEWVEFLLEKEFSFEEIKIIYPTAPQRPYTPMNGAMTSVWFDRKQISPNVPEELETVNSMCIEIQSLIDEEIKEGVPKNRIILGGFSMGGALALHLGYRFCPGLRGIFALSSFLNEGSVVYETIESRKSGSDFPPLFQAHGTADPLVDFKWGKQTSQMLSNVGVNTSFYEYQNMYHEMKKEEILKLQEWILEKVPLL